MPSSEIVVAGAAIALVIVISLFAGQAASISAQWARAALRVVGNWIAAIGVLMLGWSLRVMRQPMRPKSSALHTVRAFSLARNAARTVLKKFMLIVGRPINEPKVDAGLAIGVCRFLPARQLSRRRDPSLSPRVELRSRAASLVASVLAATLGSAFAADPQILATGAHGSGWTGAQSSAEVFSSREVPLPKSWRGFEVVPGKNPNDWSFTLEPYAWALGLSGDIDVKGLPSVHVDYGAKDILQHLDWGVFARGEVRKGRWGVLADGFFAQLSASGDPPGPLYNDVDITIQQGLASLALAYRIISDRRGFLDIYAGARYNYFELAVEAALDAGGIRDVATDVSNRLFSEVDTRVQTAVEAELLRLRTQLAEEVAILSDDIHNRLAANLESGLQNRLRQDLSAERLLRRALGSEEIRRLTRGLSGDYRAYINAVLDARVAEARARVDARLEQAKANAQARLAQAKRKLAKAIAERLEDTLPSSGSGSQWWVDPIIGLRGQVNFTRWLFLAVQGDVGGFGAGSWFAANITATLGVNITRNIFLETGYRYFYMDRSHDGFSYDAGEYGLFTGIGVKF